MLKLMVSKSVYKFFKNQNRDLKEKILSIFKHISIDYQVNSIKYDIKPLKGKENQYRLRVGKMRFLYELKHDQIIIYFFRGGFRGDVYK